MANIAARIQQVIDQMTGNEALLEMLETNAAIEMLEWGKAMVVSLVKKTEDMNDFATDLALMPRLKAVRQFMRSVGNWAAGKYTDPADRIELRDKLLGHFRTIFGEDEKLPSAVEMDAVLNQVDDKQNNSHQLILKLKGLLNRPGQGEADVQKT
jgi:hypothetical protein